MIIREMSEMLEKEGYDVHAVSESELKDLDAQFEDDMEDFLEEHIKDNQKILCMDYACRLGLQKKEEEKKDD